MQQFSFDQKNHTADLIWLQRTSKKFFIMLRDISELTHEIFQGEEITLKWKSITKSSEKNNKKDPNRKAKKNSKNTKKQQKSSMAPRPTGNHTSIITQELIRMRRWGHIVSFIYKGCHTCNSTLELDCRKKQRKIRSVKYTKPWLSRQIANTNFLAKKQDYVKLKGSKRKQNERV